jgi:hypothetical protein
MLHVARLSKRYLVFVISVAVYLKIRTPMRSVVGNTHYDAWEGRKPFLKHVCVFGWLAFVNVPNEK